MLDAIIFAAASFGAAAPCAPIPGAREIVSDKALEWIVVGEVHGTNETPAIFADLTCLAAFAGRPPIVALELPEDEADGINAFMASDGRISAVRKLIDNDFWRRSLQDGRSSQAIVRLLERLREMKADGLIRDVAPFQPVGIAAGPVYEKAMAEKIRNLPRSSNDLVLVLVGNMHALRSGNLAGQMQPAHMIDFLPKDRTVSLNATGNGGSAWTCRSIPTEMPGGTPFCGADSGRTAPVQRTRGIVRLDDPDAPYSGYLNIGEPTTAASPVWVDN